MGGAGLCRGVQKFALQKIKHGVSSNVIPAALWRREMKKGRCENRPLSLQ
jgi:hypothetical protein